MNAQFHFTTTTKESLMKSVTLNLLTAAALFGAAFSTYAADQATRDADFAQQREITDGYYPQYTVHPRVVSSGSRQTALQDREFDLERASASVSPNKPVPLSQAADSLRQEAAVTNRSPSVASAR
jgi:hypothetical protein